MEDVICKRCSGHDFYVEGEKLICRRCKTAYYYKFGNIYMENRYGDIEELKSFPYDLKKLALGASQDEESTKTNEDSKKIKSDNYDDMYQSMFLKVQKLEKEIEEQKKLTHRKIEEVDHRVNESGLDKTYFLITNLSCSLILGVFCVIAVINSSSVSAALAVIFSIIQVIVFFHSFFKNPK